MRVIVDPSIFRTKYVAAAPTTDLREPCGNGFGLLGIRCAAGARGRASARDIRPGAALRSCFACLERSFPGVFRGAAAY